MNQPFRAAAWRLRGAPRHLKVAAREVNPCAFPRRTLLLAGWFLVCPVVDLHGEPPDPQVRADADKAVARAMEFLAATQRADGSWEWNGAGDPAISALAGKCFAQHPDFGGRHPIVKRAAEFVLKFRRDNGGIYVENIGLNNYYTSVAVMFLSACKNEEYAEVISAAQAYLSKQQWDESEQIEADNAWYGGAGYGSGKRPDLSNTQVMIEALKESGLPASDPTYKKALKFIERCQMSSGTNDQAFARGADDGGFIYSPANEGESKAGYMEVRGRPMLRSYGSMTYAGFKSMLYAEVSRGDPRVVKALEWIARHWTLEENPNMPGQQSKEGLYYYYHVFAKALRAWGQPVIVDADGVSHEWRRELCAKLCSLQRPDGSWVNEADRWREGNPYLVTAYAVLALQAATE